MVVFHQPENPRLGLGQQGEGVSKNIPWATSEAPPRPTWQLPTWPTIVSIDAPHLAPKAPLRWSRGAWSTPLTSWPALAHQPTPSYLSCLAPSPPYFLHKSRWHLASSSHLWPERLQSSLTNLSSCCPRHFPSMQGPPAPLTPSRLSPACLLQALGLPLCLGRQHPAISLCFTSHFHR